MRNLTIAFLALLACSCTADTAAPEVDAGVDALVQPDADPAQPDASPDACVPHAELCNGVDDDCDGLIDEDFPDLHTPCDNGLIGECLHAGTMVCNGLDGDLSTVCSTLPGVPIPEVCDGLDNDCDGEVDEDFECEPGATTPCTTYCGLDGELTCGADCTVPTTFPDAVCQIHGGGGYCNPIDQTGCDACPATWPVGPYSCIVKQISGDGYGVGSGGCVTDPGILVEGQYCWGDHVCVAGLACAGYPDHPTAALCRPICEMGTVCNPDTGETCFPEWGWTNRWGTCH